MEYLPIILTVAVVHLLAVMSPGPDFLMILRNSIVYTRKTGVYSAIGLGLGILVHVTYCLIGLAVIISQSIVIFSIIKYIGVAYLLYIGIKSLRAKPSTAITESSDIHYQELSRWQAIRSGFITNATNPKATLFFLGLFTLVIDPATPLGIKLIMAVEVVAATVAWFSLVAVIVSHRAVRTRIHKIQHHVERVMGGILILLGIKVATEQIR
jgi:RhtB (resistance to homoserine/threonine) family protein